MKNELSEYKKKASRSFWGALAFVQTLLLTVLGLLLYYILAPNLQFSPVTEKLFLFVILIFLLVAFLVWKLWYKPASMKYFEVYRSANRFNKETKMFNIFNNRTFAVSICLTIFITFGISFWYFGHHRPAQKILNAEPMKKYNTVTPLKPKNQPSKTPGTITSHSHEEDILEADALSDQEQNNLGENTEQSRDTSVSQGKDQEREEAEDKHLQSKEEQEASKKLKAEAEAVLELAKQTQKESLELMREAIPIIVNHLNTLPQEEQRELLQQTKTAMVDQISQFPSELQPLIDDFNILEEGWKMYLDMLAEYGYTPPKGIE